MCVWFLSLISFINNNDQFYIIEAAVIVMQFSEKVLYNYWVTVKGGNFNMYIWAWFGFFICSRREIRFHLFG